jgi:predicted dehydrogenase
MIRYALFAAALLGVSLVHGVWGRQVNESGANEVRLITLAPEHFHASLFHKQMLPGVSNRVSIYAPLGPELAAHLGRMAIFNRRKENPTRWELEIYAGPDFLDRMLKERRGNAVILSGRGRGKIEMIRACVERGLHILGDKPWILDSADLPKVEAVLDAAEKKGVAAFDGMTQRFEIKNILHRELIGDPEILGSLATGSQDDPAICLQSVHYLMKMVAGVPNLRPAWFFDTYQQGEGLSDLGTHLADLVLWMVFPEQAIDWQKDVKMVAARHWPIVLTQAEFQRVTGETDFPDFLQPHVEHHVTYQRLDYFCNDTAHCTIRGIHTRLEIIWKYEAAPGEGDTETGYVRGSKSRIEVRQGKEEKFVPEIYVFPNRREDKADVLRAVWRKVEALRATGPGVNVEDMGERIHLWIPARYRVDHEAHFTMLAQRFLEYVRNPKAMPAWEKPNMLAKYYITTKSVEMAREAK